MNAVILVLLTILAKQRAQIIMLQGIMHVVPVLHPDALEKLNEGNEQTQRELQDLQNTSIEQIYQYVVEQLRLAEPHDETASGLADELEAFYHKLCAANRDTRDQSWLKDVFSKEFEQKPPPEGKE